MLVGWPECVSDAVRSFAQPGWRPAARCCRGRRWAGAGPRGLAGASGSASTLAFLSLTPKDTGITWVHDNAMSPGRYLPETCGSGCAFIDYDGDGWMDLYLVNSGPSDFFTPAKPIRNALYKNNRDGTFTDVTEQAGVPGGTFGMGVAVGDYDNDGHADMIVTAYGRPTLYHNNGNGTFTDVTKAAGLDVPGWTTSAVWFDYDNDGKLDLFLCSFVEFSGKANVICGDNKLGRRYYCIPRVFKPTPSLLFKNNGNGTFTKTSTGTDIERALGKALGVVATDINGDGLMDLFVANDTVQNFLFANRGPDPTGKTKWEELGLAAEVAFSANGQPRSGMGVDAADFDQDGLQDLFVANVDQEMFSLYKNRGSESFADVAHANGIAQATRLLSGWGLKFFDYDNDGHLDLMLANGHPDDMIEQYSTQVKYAEPLLLFHNEGGKLKDVSKGAGAAFTPHLSRPRPRRRRLQQRRPPRRRDLEQRRGAGDPQERRRRGPSLARADAAGRHLQPRRDRRQDHVVVRRPDADAAQDLGRQLPVVARSARGARRRRRLEDRLGRDHLAAAERARRAPDRTCRSIATSVSIEGKGIQ